MPSQLRANIEATMKGFLHSQETAYKNTDERLVTEYLTPTCRRLIRPRSFMESIGHLCDPDATFNNTHSVAAFRENWTAFETEWTQIEDDWTIDETRRKASARTTQYLRFADGECFPDRNGLVPCAERGWD
jgi:hypothetical protein